MGKCGGMQATHLPYLSQVDLSVLKVYVTVNIHWPPTKCKATPKTEEDLEI